MKINYKELAKKETNEMLLRRFVSMVGYDYDQDYSPYLYPDFSEDTVAYWHEIERRMNDPVYVGFNSEEFIREIKEQINMFDKLLEDEPGSAKTSFYIGERNGLKAALDIAYTWQYLADEVDT